MKPHGLLVPTLFTLLGLGVLIGLGTWQVQRLAWKQGLIDRIETRSNATPVALSQALSNWRETQDVEYLRVSLEGRFRHQGEQHLYAIVGGKPGWRVVTPLKTPTGLWVMVDRGFVPPDFKAAEARQDGQIEGNVRLTGLARAPGQRGSFTPQNELDENKWFSRDLDAMAARALPSQDRDKLAPFFVEAEAMDLPGGLPRGSTTRLKITNRHLEYAITWYALAVVLLVIYAINVRNWLRRR